GTERNDLVKSLLLSSRSVTIAPRSAGRLATYVTRAAHLATRAPRQVIQLPLPHIQHATFDATGNWLLTITDEYNDDNLKVWNVTDGSELQIPLQTMGTAFHVATKPSPVFSPDGRYIAAIVYIPRNTTALFPRTPQIVIWQVDS